MINGQNSIDTGHDGNLKQWISGILPCELLERPLKKAVESILTLCECTTFYKKFPDNVVSPNYGDKWGRLANYIEINNRAICTAAAAKTE